MKHGICNFGYNLILSIAVVFLGVFFTKLIVFSLISFMEHGQVIIPFLDIFFLSIKIGLIGGSIGGVGIWLIYRFNIH